MSIQERISGRFTLSKVLYLYARMRLTPCDPKMKTLKDKYKGRRCFIVGLGPSLCLEDLNKLNSNKEICFSMNHVFQLYNKTEWRPNYYHISDICVYSDEVQQAMKSIEKEGKSTILCSKWNIPWKSDTSISFKTNSIRKVFSNSKFSVFNHLNLKYKFSTNAERCLYDGASGVHNLIQIAYYMGFKEVYLLGVDCGSSGKKEYAEGLAEQKVRNYSKQVGEQMIRDFCEMNEDIKNKRIDFEVFNASRGGQLEVFPRVNLDDLVK